MARKAKERLRRNAASAGSTARHTADAVTSVFRFAGGLVSVLAGALACVLILYSGYVLYDTMAVEDRAKNSVRELLQYKPAAQTDETQDRMGPEALTEINPDYRMWLTVDETRIDYPVVQGKDDLYYASHDIYKNNSLTGAIYLAAGNSGGFTDSYNIIYGHHMDSGLMFGDLDRFTDEGYFSSHQTGTIIAGGTVYDITLFAAVTTDAYVTEIYTPGNRMNEVIAYLNSCMGEDGDARTNVLIYHPSELDGGTKIVALSTCASATTDGRLVVFAVVTEHKEPQTPEPGPTTPEPGPTTPEPGPTTPEPGPTTPEPGPTTPEPGPTTPEPGPTTPEPGPTTPEPGPTTPEPGPTTPEPGPTTPGPGPTTPGPGPTTPGPETPTPEPGGPTPTPTKPEPEPTPTEKPTPTPKPTLTLTIYYVYDDGTTAATTYTQQVEYGEDYDIYSPVIPGYTAAPELVSGTNPGHDEEYTVIYVPEDTIIDDHNTPTFLGEDCVQIGICWE